MRPHAARFDTRKASYGLESGAGGCPSQRCNPTLPAFSMRPTLRPGRAFVALLSDTGVVIGQAARPPRMACHGSVRDFLPGVRFSIGRNRPASQDAPGPPQAGRVGVP